MLMSTQPFSTEIYDAKALNGMLRAELAAVESYNQAIRNLPHPSVHAELEAIRDEHQSAACSLGRFVRERQDAPPANCLWGYFTAAVTGMAALIGDFGLLAALKRGERFGESTYRSALGNPDLPDDVRHLVGSRLLPQCQGRLHRLERLAPLVNSAVLK
jgi:hypothetical protein